MIWERLTDHPRLPNWIRGSYGCWWYKYEDRKCIYVPNSCSKTRSEYYTIEHAHGEEFSTVYQQVHLFTLYNAVFHDKETKKTKVIAEDEWCHRSTNCCKTCCEPYKYKEYRHCHYFILEANNKQVLKCPECGAQQVLVRSNKARDPEWIVHLIKPNATEYNVMFMWNLEDVYFRRARRIISQFARYCLPRLRAVRKLQAVYRQVIKFRPGNTGFHEAEKSFKESISKV